LRRADAAGPTPAGLGERQITADRQNTQLVGKRGGFFVEAADFGSPLHRRPKSHALRDFFPDIPAPVLASSIERYRALGLYALTPVMPPEGFERLQRAMLQSAALSRKIPFKDCVDNTLAEEAVSPHIS
jgi:hypothetical protein